MSGLSDIPVEVIDSCATAAEPSPQLLAILQELETMLKELIDSGEQNSIDIRSLPMMPGDYEQLKMILGEGEVQATVNTLGPSQVMETKIPGIWWISHRNAHDEVLAEFIEVTSLPEILKPQPGDLKEAIEILHRQVTGSEQDD
jgi:hydrogenase-1 operon protein HyaF